MANLYVGFTTAQRGIEADETGINTQGFSMEYSHQWKDKRNGYNGQVRGFAVPDKYVRKASVTGDVIVGSTTGVMAGQAVIAYVFANDVIDFLVVTGTANTGGFYSESPKVDQSEGGWRTFSCDYTSDPGVS